MKKIILSLIFALTFLSVSNSVLALTPEEMFQQQQQQEQFEAAFEETQGTANTILAGFGIAFALAMLFGIVSLIAFIWALVDILKSDMGTGAKIGWVVLCIILGVIGVIVYYFVVKRKRPSEEKPTEEPKTEESSEKGESNFCHSCGKEAKQGAKFCPGCGEKV